VTICNYHVEKTLDLETLYGDLDRVTRMPARGSKRLAQILYAYREDAFLMKNLATIVCDLPIKIDLATTNIRKPTFSGI